MIPTYVVIPVKDNLPLTSALVAQLRDQGGYEAIFVFDNGSADDTRAWLAAQAARGDLVAIDASGMTLHQIWNDGIALSRALHPACNIAILNNDLRIAPASSPDSHRPCGPTHSCGRCHPTMTLARSTASSARRAVPQRQVRRGVRRLTSVPNRRP